MKVLLVIKNPRGEYWAIPSGRGDGANASQATVDGLTVFVLDVVEAFEVETV